jgi:hypothetical protein
VGGSTVVQTSRVGNIAVFVFCFGTAKVFLFIFVGNESNSLCFWQVEKYFKNNFIKLLHK